MGLAFGRKGKPEAKTRAGCGPSTGERLGYSLIGHADGAVAVWREGPGKYEGMYEEEGKPIRAKNPVILISDYGSFIILYAWTGKEVEKIWLSD